MRRLKLAAMALAALSGVAVFGWVIFPALSGAFTLQEAGSIAIIGGADGPTAIYTTIKPAPHVIAITMIFFVSLFTWLALLFKTRRK